MNQPMAIAQTQVRSFFFWSWKRLRNWRATVQQRLTRHNHQTFHISDDEVTDFDINVIEQQIRAVHQLEVWRAAREAYPVDEVDTCPTRPRFLKGVLTPAEEEHLVLCSRCQDTIRTIPFYQLRSALRRLHRWHIDAVQKAAAFVDRHKAVTLIPTAIQLVVFLTCVHVVHLGMEAITAPQNRVDGSGPVLSVDLTNGIMNTTTSADQQQLLKTISRLQKEITDLRKSAERYRRTMVREQRGIATAENVQVQFVGSLPTCNTVEERHNSVWCLPSAEINRRQEAISNYLYLYRAFEAERENFAIHNSAHEPPRGSYTPMAPNY